MRLIIIGCEFTGKTTLARNLSEWMERELGSCTTSFHDHFLPWDPADPGPKGERIDDELKLLSLNEPSVVDKYNRYVIHYHTHPGFYSSPGPLCRRLVLRRRRLRAALLRLRGPWP